MNAIDFDPRKHRIVAVDVDPDSPERGNHFHLSLPDLVREAAELPAIDWSPLERKIAAVESELSALKTLRAPAPLPVPLIAQTVPDVDGSIAALSARVEALESVPTAQVELSGALRAVLLLMQDMDGRAKALEDEARVVRATLEDTLPVMRAVAAGQRG